MPKQVPFKKKTDKFIETGSNIGTSIQLALYSGFSEIYSIELSETLYNFCKNKFINNPNVHLFLGDSTSGLKNLFEQMPNTPFTFWLDAHDDYTTPLMEELEVILSRNVNGELIYIDDMRLYNNLNEFVNIDAITNLVKKYKPEATFAYENDDWAVNDILIIEY